MRALAWIVVAACGGPPQPQPVANAPVTPSARALAEMRIFFDDDHEAALTIHDDGMIEFDDGTRPLRVTADGKVFTNPGTKWSQGGAQLVAAIQPDGSVAPDLFHATIGPDGTTILKPNAFNGLTQDMTLSLDAGGHVIGGDPPGKTGRVEGASTPALRRTAMIVLLAFDLVILSAAIGAAAGP